jgi:hypothetical protein
MPSSTSNFERHVPDLPWRGLLVAVVVVTAGISLAWELTTRAWGYRPTLNDTPTLWAHARSNVWGDSIVIIGDSRPLFDLDLDELQQGLGSRPIQLANAGSCAYPILEDLANDKAFHGTVICSITPGLWFAPAGPPIRTSEQALAAYHKGTFAQKVSGLLGALLETQLACLKEDDLTLDALLRKVHIRDRPGALLPPQFPPYFSTMDFDRRTRMAEACAVPGALQTRVKTGWLPLFHPPPPPTYVPRDVFLADVQKAIARRFTDTAAAVEKLRSRGGKIVFVRFPMTSELKKLEDAATPRAGPWDHLLAATRAPGIYFEDYPELAGFQCPEWSHLSAADSVVFTHRLIPHLRQALGN